MFGPSLLCETSMLFPPRRTRLVSATTMTSADFSFSLNKQGDLPW
jgi:hypothetical protein